MITDPQPLLEFSTIADADAYMLEQGLRVAGTHILVNDHELTLYAEGSVWVPVEFLHSDLLARYYGGVPIGAAENWPWFDASFAPVTITEAGDQTNFLDADVATGYIYVVSPYTITNPSLGGPYPHCKKLLFLRIQPNVPVGAPSYAGCRITVLDGVQRISLTLYGANAAHVPTPGYAGAYLYNFVIQAGTSHHNVGVATFTDLVMTIDPDGTVDLYDYQTYTLLQSASYSEIIVYDQWPTMMPMISVNTDTTITGDFTLEGDHALVYIRKRGRGKRSFGSVTEANAWFTNIRGGVADGDSCWISDVEVCYLPSTFFGAWITEGMWVPSLYYDDLQVTAILEGGIPYWYGNNANWAWTRTQTGVYTLTYAGDETYYSTGPNLGDTMFVSHHFASPTDTWNRWLIHANMRVVNVAGDPLLIVYLGGSKAWAHVFTLTGNPWSVGYYGGVPALAPHDMGPGYDRVIFECNMVAAQARIFRYETYELLCATSTRSLPPNPTSPRIEFGDNFGAPGSNAQWSLKGQFGLTVMGKP